MNMRKLFLLTILLTSLTGCDRYWWTRGQPPSSEELLSRATAGFDEQVTISNESRKDIAQTTKDLRDHLITASKHVSRPENLRPLREELATVEDLFNQLQQRVSIESRAPIAELSGQLRAIQTKSEKGEVVEPAVFELFASRTLFLLANELTVPPPPFS